MGAIKNVRSINISLILPGTPEVIYANFNGIRKYCIKPCYNVSILYQYRNGLRHLSLAFIFFVKLVLQNVSLKINEI